MPIYEYACDQCKKINEVTAKISDPPPAACQYCGGSSLKKIISQTAFVLQGSGWYVTDYKNSAKPSANKSSEKKPEGTPEQNSGDSKSSEPSQSKDATGKNTG